MYEERRYREGMKTEGLVGFTVCDLETDLQIFAGSNLKDEAKAVVSKHRKELTEYITKHPKFLSSLTPLVPEHDAPAIVREMCNAGRAANVGPMAAVAGAVSKYAGRHLLRFTNEVIVENGGDIYIKSKKERKILIYAGSSILSNKLALLVPGGDKELGICTSSGTVGHSLSFGKADAAVILADDAVLADAAATATGNVVKDKGFIEAGLEFAMSIPGVNGVVIIVGDSVGACGDVNIIKP